MNKTVKDAVFMIVLGVPGLIICGLTFYLIAWTGIIENPLVFWGGLWFGYSFVGLMWVLPLVKSGKNVHKGYDERDLLIFKRAVLVAYSVLWMYFVTACISICWLKGPNADVPLSLFLGIIFAGAILFMLVHSLTILVQYGWRK